MEVVVTTEAISHAKLQSNHHHQQPTPNFLQAGCPSCHPINSVKALKRKKSEIKSISRQLLNIAFTAFTGCQAQLMT